jgi:hypothetical protein
MFVVGDKIHCIKQRCELSSVTILGSWLLVGHIHFGLSSRCNPHGGVSCMQVYVSMQMH